MPPPSIALFLDNSVMRSIAMASAAPLALLVPPLWRCQWSTPVYANLHGLDSEALEGQELRACMAPSQWCQWQRLLDKMLFAGLQGERNLRVELPFDQSQTIATHLKALFVDGQLAGVLVIPDVAMDLRQALQHVQQSDSRMRRFASATSEAILFYTLQGVVLDANDAAVRLCGYPLAQLTGMSLQELVPASERAKLQQRLQHPSDDPFLTRLRRRDGQIMEIEAIGRRMNSSDGNYGIAVLHDITARKQAQAQLDYLAQHDPLTQLPNRHGLHRSLNTVLASATELRHHVVVALIDLERFKDVNDSFGNDAGDKVLREVARRLRSKLHPDDLLSRIGSDEFALALGTRASVSQAECTFREIRHALAKPFNVGDMQVSIQASMGICQFPDDGLNADELLRNAHAAMCHAREVGTSAEHYNRQLAERPSRLLALEQQLRDAVKHNQLVLHYQPQWDLQHNRLAGFEALLRWQHPQRGLLYPGDFIAFAESRGLIALLGRWVMRAACQQVRQWQAQGMPAVPVAVNVSALEFRQPQLVQQMAQILHEEQIDPQWLEIELTESALMRESDCVLQTLQDMKALGLRLALDDFGTGYSSLAYLRHYPLDKLKIDRSFLRETPQNQSDVSLIKAMLQMASSLQMRTVAEGVETAAQLQLLQDLGCDIAQGFYLARPLTVEAATAYGLQQPICHIGAAQ